MVLHTTKFHSELLYFLRTFACVSCPVCRIIGKVNRYLHCSDMSISQCSWAIKNPVFNRWSRSVDSRIHAKEVSISMKLHDLSKIFLTVVAIDQNSQKIVSRIDTAPSFLLWRIELVVYENICWTKEQLPQPSIATASFPSIADLQVSPDGVAKQLPQLN